MSVEYISIGDMSLSDLNDILKSLNDQYKEWDTVSRAKLREMKLTESCRRDILGKILMQRLQISTEISYRKFTPVNQED